MNRSIRVGRRERGLVVLKLRGTGHHPKERGSFQLRGNCVSGVKKCGEIAPEIQAFARITIWLPSERSSLSQMWKCEPAFPLHLLKYTEPEPFSVNRWL